MIQFDAKVIQSFAARLYTRARLLVVLYSLFGVSAGAIVGKAYDEFLSITASIPRTIVGTFMPSPAKPRPRSSFMLGGILFGGLAGFWIGSSKAFNLKLQAQTALCQLKIEENTAHRQLESQVRHPAGV